jgi:transcriptional regulator with XRE-family HTH domain
MNKGAKALRDWLSRSGLSSVAAAKRLGLTKSYFSYLLNGHRKPGLPLAVAIERKAGIPVNSWTQRVARSARAKSSRATNPIVDKVLTA